MWYHFVPRVCENAHHKIKLTRQSILCPGREYFTGHGTVGSCVLRHGIVAYVQAQAWVCNVEMKYDHAYCSALHNQEIQECERAIHDQNYTN